MPLPLANSHLDPPGRVAEMRGTGMHSWPLQRLRVQTYRPGGTLIAPGDRAALAQQLRAPGSAWCNSNLCAFWICTTPARSTT
jgi:hypothetical protein